MLDLGEIDVEEIATALISGLAAALQPGERLGTKEDLRARCSFSVGTFNGALRMVQARGIAASSPDREVGCSSTTLPPWSASATR